MLKILFSPSEGKTSGGVENISQEIFGSTEKRAKILKEYNHIVLSRDETSITELFGIKKFSACTEYIQDIYNAPLMSAIERYNGVAYEYLSFPTLDEDSKSYLQENTIIFSNLYGPILGGDMIPNYKVKQGNSVGSISPEKFYQENFTDILDAYLQNDEILDLRAGYYEKFYKIKKAYTTLKFLKNGKSVSHWAKAYRGIVLKEIAKNAITNLEDFGSLEIENLALKEIKKIKNKTEIIYDITNEG